MAKRKKPVGEHIAAPYSRILIPDPDSGTFTARVMEFPGCVAQGDTAAEAYANVESAAEAWVQAALDLGQAIPLPAEAREYSGRILVRLPRSLHRRASELATMEGTSLNQLIVAAVAESVGAGGVARTKMKGAERP